MWGRATWMVLAIVLCTAVPGSATTMIHLGDSPSGSVTLLPSGLYQYDYQIVNFQGFAGTFSIPDPGNVVSTVANGPGFSPWIQTFYRHVHQYVPLSVDPYLLRFLPTIRSRHDYVVL